MSRRHRNRGTNQRHASEKADKNKGSTPSVTHNVRDGAFDPAALFVNQRMPSFETTHIAEPELIFGGHRRLVDPRLGLGLYGPFDVNEDSRPGRIRLGIIGSGPLVDMARRWIERGRSKIMPIRRVRRKGSITQEAMDPTVYPPFPGVDQAFGTQFVLVDTMIETITAGELAQLKLIPLFETRVTLLIDLLVSRLRVLVDKSARPDVVLVALPTEVRELCTIASHHKTRAKQPLTLAQSLKRNLAADAAVGQLNIVDIASLHGVDVTDVPEDDEHAVLHHGLKARAMEIGMPTQLVWQGTLEGSTSVEDESTRAWNFWTGIYYKAGGTPWRVTGLERGTCFVGLSFYRDRERTSLRTCMAQAFSDQGEGIVLRSEPFKWDPLKSPHLTTGLARDLMTRVLTAYGEHMRQSPSRVVVHKWQRYLADERTGFEEAVAAAGVHSSDLVAFGDRGLRFFRAGAEPVLRGTTVTLSATNALLYTRGYVPYLASYNGMRVPRPLEIVEHFGSASMIQICREVLALTKMDWNSSAFAGKEPITTAFAEDVGHILAEVPDGVAPKPNYRFYM